MERYATLFYAEYDPETCSLAYVNAGHNPPMVLRPNGAERAVIRLEAGGTGVGLLPEARWGPGKFQLQAGCLFRAVPGGINETMKTGHGTWGAHTVLGPL